MPRAKRTAFPDHRGFSVTLNNSTLVGPKQRVMRLNYCCGAFHGYAHNRLCQLNWHPLYVDGSGLEDFEANERVYSESNRIASITRHATKFHRRQKILMHFDRWNADKYEALSMY